MSPLSLPSHACYQSLLESYAQIVPFTQFACRVQGIEAVHTHSTSTYTPLIAPTSSSGLSVARMVQLTYTTALRELKSSPPPPPEDQLLLLRLLKNEIIGHGQRKEHVVRLGLLEPLAQILFSTTDFPGNKTPSTSQPTLEHEIRLQATILVGSLATGTSSLPSMRIHP